MIPTFGTQAIHMCQKISFKPQTGLRKVLDIVWRCQSYNIRLCKLYICKAFYMFLNLENTKQKTHHTPGPSELRARHFFPVAECHPPWKTPGTVTVHPDTPGATLSSDLGCQMTWGWCLTRTHSDNMFIIWHSDCSVFITINPAENIFKHI